MYQSPESPWFAKNCASLFIAQPTEMTTGDQIWVANGIHISGPLYYRGMERSVLAYAVLVLVILALLYWHPAAPAPNDSVAGMWVGSEAACRRMGLASLHVFVAPPQARSVTGATTHRGTALMIGEGGDVLLDQPIELRVAAPAVGHRVQAPFAPNATADMSTRLTFSAPQKVWPERVVARLSPREASLKLIVPRAGKKSQLLAHMYRHPEQSAMALAAFAQQKK